MLKYLKFVLPFLLACCFGTVRAYAGGNGEKGIDVKDIVIGHMSDEYEWHITTINDHHISIPLPVIVKSEQGGWHCFSSSYLTHLTAGENYQGFFIDEESGKIMELQPDGSHVRPWDLSVTKNVASIWIAVVLLISIFLCCASWYKKRSYSDDAPKGFVGFIEMLVVTIQDDVIKECIGEKHYKPFVPYLLTVFFFILTCNLMGVVPLFPGGANVTGNISVTLVLAIGTFLAINIFGNRHYWLEVFWPDVPTWLKVPVPLMPVIEIIGILTKPFALMIRLFANMMSGHAVMLSLTCVIFVGFQVNAILGSTLTVVSVLLTIFMNFLEVLIDFVQAYIFTMLSAVFIGMAQAEHEHKTSTQSTSATDTTVISTNSVIETKL